jgi:hypothetical protein
MIVRRGGCCQISDKPHDGGSVKRVGPGRRVVVAPRTTDRLAARATPGRGRSAGVRDGAGIGLTDRRPRGVRVRVRSASWSVRCRSRSCGCISASSSRRGKRVTTRRPPDAISCERRDGRHRRLMPSAARSRRDACCMKRRVRIGRRQLQEHPPPSAANRCATTQQTILLAAADQRARPTRQIEQGRLEPVVRMGLQFAPPARIVGCLRLGWPADQAHEVTPVFLSRPRHETRPMQKHHPLRFVGGHVPDLDRD